MPITFACPKCGEKYHVKDEFAGKKTACRQCQMALIVPSSAPLAPIPIEPIQPIHRPPPPQVVVVQNDDRRPGQRTGYLGAGFGLAFGGTLGHFAARLVILIVLVGLPLSLCLCFGIFGSRQPPGNIVTQKPQAPLVEPTPEEKVAQEEKDTQAKAAAALAEEKRLAAIQADRAAEEKTRIANLETKRLKEEQRQKDAERLLKEANEAAEQNRKAKLEKDASRKLTLAKAQLEEGRAKAKNEKTRAEGLKLIAFAKAKLEEIVRDFPQATATVEARKLLDGLK